MGILSDKYGPSDPIQDEWDQWVDGNAGKPFADSDAAYAEITVRHKIEQEEKFHRPSLGTHYADDGYKI